MCAKVKVLCSYSITMPFLATECLVPFASLCKTCSIQYTRDTKPPQVFLALGYEAVENRVRKLVTKSSSTYLIAL